MAISDDDMEDIGIENVDMVGVESSKSSTKKQQIWSQRQTLSLGRHRYPSREEELDEVNMKDTSEEDYMFRK